MAHVIRTVTVDRPIGAVSAYLSDFSSTAEWDPHTVSCRRLDEGPLRVGSRFENVQQLAGRTTTLTYELTGYEPGRRAVLQGSSKGVVSRDELVFAESGQGTTVTYTVDIAFRGALRIAEPLLPLIMGRLADQGAAGMRRQLLTP